MVESTSGDGKKSGTRWWMWMLGVAAFGVLIYQPIPEKLLGHNTHDRIVIHILDPIMRLVYKYPLSLCPDAKWMAWWADLSLGGMARIIGSWSNTDPDLTMHTTSFDGVKVRTYQLTNFSAATGDHAVIFFHGGGFVLGDISSYESTARELTKSIRPRLFVSVEYRLAPNTIFPGAPDDCERVVDYVMKHGASVYGIDPTKIIVAGDSAGGNLAAVTSQRFTFTKKAHKLMGQILIYPVVQLIELQSPSYRMQSTYSKLSLPDPYSVAAYLPMYGGIDVVGHPEYIEAIMTNGHVSPKVAQMYRELVDYSSLPTTFTDGKNGTIPKAEVVPIAQLQKEMEPILLNPDFSPMMRKDLRGLPPALVLSCEYDLLRDEDAIYAERLRRAGVPTKYIHYEHGFHVMLNMHWETHSGRRMIEDIADWTKDLVTGRKEK